MGNLFLQMTDPEKAGLLAELERWPPVSFKRVVLTQSKLHVIGEDGSNMRKP
jgi:hypothetical protein